MGERLTDDELAALEHQRVWSEDEQRLLLTEVRERRGEDYDLNAEALAHAAMELREAQARIAQLEAALRECVTALNGTSSACAYFGPTDEEDRVLDRARAALKGGG